MPVNSVVVSDDLGLQIGNARAALTPSAAFTVAEQLIRAATRAIVIDEADRAAVLDTVRNPAAALRN